MRRNPRLVAVLVAMSVSLTVALTACTGDDEPTPTGSTTAAGPSATPSGADASPTASGGTASATTTYLDDDVTVAVHPLQVQGGQALLTADFSLPASAAKPVSLGIVLRSPGTFLNAGQLRLLDLAGRKVYQVGTSGGRVASTQGPMNLAPGATVTVQAFFAAPAASTVDLLLPWFGLVPDVPVEQAATLSTSPDQLGVTGQVEYVAAPIDAFNVAYDSSSASRVEGDAATVTLSSDVLFATGKYELTPAAKKVVDQAAAEIKATGKAGIVQVVGHTDDVASEAFNLKLSVQRANSVAARLRPALGSQFTVTTQGKGETDPAVKGTSPAARKANRRVEVAFTTSTSGATVTAPSDAPAPKATGPVGTGSSPVAVTVNGTSYEVAATSVERRGGYLVGTLRVTRTSAGSGNLTGFFGDAAAGLDLGRGLNATTMTAGAFNATLLGQGARVYPADYVVAPETSTSTEQRAIVADRFLDQPIAQGQSVAVTVVWPDAGGSTVDVDVPDRFRITGVQVTGP